MIRVEKGQRKKSTWDGPWIEKKILLVHDPPILVHSWVLVHSGQNLAASNKWNWSLWSWNQYIETKYQFGDYVVWFPNFKDSS